MAAHPSQVEMLRWFTHGHLPAPLAEVAEQFETFAAWLYERAEDDQMTGPELTTALRKLLEAKDCAVRATLAAAEPS